MQRIAFLTLALAASALTVACAGQADAPRPQRISTASAPARPSPPHTPAPPATAAQDHGHDHAHDAERVPAFQADAASLKNLPPTLAPEKFMGKQRLAYMAVREIPQTIAQLPCYCYCDQGFGHKSLHSCFVDDHAAHCAVCVDEALLAYKLQKEEKLSPAKIRERIIAQYAQGS